MRGIRRLVVCTAVTGLIAAGAVGASMEVAHANFADLCDGSASTSPAWTCQVTGTIPDPSAITVSVTDDTANAAEEVLVNWTVSCTDSTNGTLGTAGAPEDETPATVDLTLPVSADGQCTATATVSLPASELSTSGFTPNDFTVQLDYTPATPASPSPTPTTTSTAAAVHPVKGYDGKCLDDKYNSSANRAEVVIWSCSGSDQAENWTFSHDELIHNGKCLNDKGDGGSGSKVILYTCNGGANEWWGQAGHGELQMKAHNYTLCLDDPAYSKKNGTQLIVYTCKGSSNQKWSVP